MQEQNQEFVQGMNLREGLEIMMRRKKIILSFFLIATVAVGAVSLVLPRNYEISALIEPPVIGITETGSSLFAESPLNLKAILSEGAFDLNVVKSLGLGSRKNKVKIKISVPRDSTVLKIALTEPENEKELGVRILNQYLAAVSNYYKDVIEFKKDDMDRLIAVVSNRIKDANNSIQLNKESLKIIEERERELVGELRDTKANTEELVSKRNGLLGRKIPAEDISSLMYTNTIQQNITYFTQLNNQFAQSKTKKEDMANAIKTLQIEINNSGLKIEKLKATKEAIRNIKLVKEPQPSLEPVGLSRGKKVILAGVIGFALGTLWAFFVEYWSKTRAK